MNKNKRLFIVMSVNKLSQLNPPKAVAVLISAYFHKLHYFRYLPSHIQSPCSQSLYEPAQSSRPPPEREHSPQPNAGQNTHRENDQALIHPHPTPGRHGSGSEDQGLENLLHARGMEVEREWRSAWQKTLSSAMKKEPETSRVVKEVLSLNRKCRSP